MSRRPSLLLDFPSARRGALSWAPGRTFVLDAMIGFPLRPERRGVQHPSSLFSHAEHHEALNKNGHPFQVLQKTMEVD